MTRPILFSFARRWFWGGGLMLLLFAVGLVVVNLVDGLPFWLAWRRAHGLEPAELEAMVAACRRYEKTGYLSWAGDEIPAEFRGLKPLKVSLSRGHAYLSLCDRQEYLSVWVYIVTDPDAARVVCNRYGSYGQIQHVLWKSERARQLDPVDRLVTVRESRMHAFREWVVRPQEIVAISAEGPSPTVVHFPLAAGPRAEVEAALFGLGDDLRGHAFEGPGVDGVSLHVSFAADGEDSPHDIVLSNAWRPELAPLVEAISRATDRENAIRFPERIARFGGEDQNWTVRAMTLRDYARWRNRIPLPWWRIWPRIDFGG